MSELIKCDRCGEITKADSSGEKRYKIGLDGFDGYSTFHVCEECLHSFYADYLGWVWNFDEEQYIPQDEQVGNHKLPELSGEDARGIKMTYGDIYKQFYVKFPNAEVNDWRPADPLFIPELLKPIQNAILVWLKDGSKLVFISEEGKTNK